MQRYPLEQLHGCQRKAGLQAVKSWAANRETRLTECDRAERRTGCRETRLREYEQAEWRATSREARLRKYDRAEDGLQPEKLGLQLPRKKPSNPL